MPDKHSSTWLTEEVADFLASRPSEEAILAYRPSPQTRERLSKLMARTKTGRLTDEEQWELDQFEHLEMLLQLIKARLRTPKAVRP